MPICRESLAFAFDSRPIARFHTKAATRVVVQIYEAPAAFATGAFITSANSRVRVDHDCGQIPVIENQSTGKPVGVVTDRDIIIRAIAKGKNPLDMTARDVMSSPAVTVTPDTRIEDCCQTLEDKQVRRVPVIDDRGRCCGMVSQADIAQHAPEKMTAEVVRTVSQPVPV